MARAGIENWVVENWVVENWVVENWVDKASSLRRRSAEPNQCSAIRLKLAVWEVAGI